MHKNPHKITMDYGLLLVLLVLLCAVLWWAEKRLLRNHERFLLRYLADLSASQDGQVVAFMLDQGCLPTRMLTRDVADKNTVIESPTLSELLTDDDDPRWIAKARTLRQCVRQVAQRLAFLWRFYDPHTGRAMDTRGHPAALHVWLSRFMPKPPKWGKEHNEVVGAIWLFLETKVTPVEREGLKKLIATAEFRSHTLRAWERMLQRASENPQPMTETKTKTKIMVFEGYCEEGSVWAVHESDDFGFVSAHSDTPAELLERCKCGAAVALEEGEEADVQLKWVISPSSSHDTETMADASPPESKRSKLNPEAPAFASKNGKGAGRADSMPPPGTRFVLSWDIEKSGPRTDKHSMLAIGGVVVRVHDNKLMDSIRIFMKMEKGHGFSDVCRKEYWYDWDRFPMNQEILELVEEKGVEPKEGIQQFADWLDQQERTYSESGLALATDNPASDARWVSHYFQKYLDRNPMIHPYGDETKYRRLHHSNAFGRALSLDDGSGGQWCERLRAKGIQVPPDDLHDHDPLNDAKWIAKLYTACLRWTRCQRYGLKSSDFCDPTIE